MNSNNRMYYIVTGIVFLIIAAAHLLRIVYRWEAQIGGVDIPLWTSWVAVLLAGYLASRGLSVCKKR